jgi:amino acid adenylation domain-containing protein
MTAPAAFLHELLERSAVANPDALALEDPERQTAISYGGLDAIAERLRISLAAHGVRPGDRVGICAPKSIGVVAAIFGILKSGAAYVPVDPEAPPQRNAFIFADCSVRVVVVSRPLEARLLSAAEGGLTLVQDEIVALSGYGIDFGLLGGVAAPAGEPDTEVAVAGQELSYILYTSGSTGRPKGVVHTHASALSFVNWCSDAFLPTAADRFSSHAPFHFDLSILDLYVPLKHGAALVLIGEELGKQPARLAATIADRRITVWYSAPSILRMLAEYGDMEQHDYSALRHVLFAGEVFPVKHLRTLQQLWPHPRYFNLYGPTETNVCTYYEVPYPVSDDRTQPFPIGATCDNDRTRVVDEQGQDVTPGDEGELLVHGGTVMQGYWNLPDRNAVAFLADAEGHRWYRTGDLVRDTGEGVYDFIGRRDRMVKRRGYRVELGEIEAALYRHPSVQEAAVVATPDETSGVLISACLATSDGKPISIIAIKKFCSENLPLYMIPDRFLYQAALPKTSTDKIDYQGLKRMSQTGS